MANAAFRSAASGGDSSFTTTTISATVPAGTIQDDGGLIFYSSAAATPTEAPTHTTPAGWTELGTTVANGLAAGALNVRLTVYYRTEPASPASATLTSSINAAHAWTRASYDNVLTSGWGGQVVFSTFSGTSAVATGLTTTKENALIGVYVAQGAAQAFTPDASLTERNDNATQGLEWADAIKVTIGATGTRTGTPAASTDGVMAFVEMWREPAFNVTGTGPRSFSLLGHGSFGAGSFGEFDRGTASAGGSHATSGAVSASPSVVAGSAVRLALHTTSGALAASSASIAGSAADHHSNIGALSAGSVTITGTSAHLTLHASTGALSAQSASMSGAAAHQHASTGALVAGSATIAGTADHTIAGSSHATSGALSAQSASTAGAATHLTLHASSGALSADAADVSGTATHIAIHATSGALTADAASIAGAAQLTSLNPVVNGDTHDAAVWAARYRKKKIEEPPEEEAEDIGPGPAPIHPAKPMVVAESSQNHAVLENLRQQTIIASKLIKSYAQSEQDDEEFLLLM